MKPTLFIFLTFIFSFSLAQENCTNGIDDDGDGFIDLNDADCECLENINLVSNGDFENYTDLPNGPEQLRKAIGWIDPIRPYDINMANANYNHWDAFNQIPDYPYPSGKGIVTTENYMQDITSGSAVEEGESELFFYKELFGTNLEEELVAGTTYVFSLFIYRLNDNDVTWPQLNVGLWGKNEALRLYEIEYAKCPDHQDEWSELTRVPFYPKNEWKKISVEFTVEENISSIIIGLTCGLPREYYDIRGTKIFAYDNISIQKKNEDFSLQSTGLACSDNLILSAQSSSDFVPTSYQWYKDGIAIAGEINASLNITEDMPEAYYSVRGMNNETCRNSEAFAYIQPLIDFRYSIEMNDSNKSIRLYDIWNQADFIYSIDNINYQAQPYFTNLLKGEGFIYVKTREGCLVKEIPYVIFEIYNVITPNGDGLNDVWQIKGIENYPGTNIIIYNQLGAQKFNYTIPRNLEKFEWDGTKSGTPLPSGEYWYLIEVNDGRKIKGSITIKRN